MTQIRNRKKRKEKSNQSVGKDCQPDWAQTKKERKFPLKNMYTNILIENGYWKGILHNNDIKTPITTATFDEDVLPQVDPKFINILPQIQIVFADTT